MASCPSLDGRHWDLPRTQFTRWKNHDEYQKAFERILRELKAVSK